MRKNEKGEGLGKREVWKEKEKKGWKEKGGEKGERKK